MAHFGLSRISDEISIRVICDDCWNKKLRDVIEVPSHKHCTHCGKDCSEELLADSEWQKFQLAPIDYYENRLNNTKLEMVTVTPATNKDNVLVPVPREFLLTLFQRLCTQDDGAAWTAPNGEPLSYLEIFTDMIASGCKFVPLLLSADLDTALARAFRFWATIDLWGAPAAEDLQLNLRDLISAVDNKQAKRLQLEEINK